MTITFDPVKRATTLRDRKLDFVDAAALFAGRHVIVVDDRFEYGETRFITAGWISRRMVVVVWTQRGDEQQLSQ